MKITEYVVQNGEECDEILHRKGFDVNIRLYNSNSEYRRIVQEVIEYMMVTKELSFEDYSRVKGISGANIGIPLNIIIVKKKIMINPKIVDKTFLDLVYYNTTCGSIPNTYLLVPRPSWVTVEYYDLDGIFHKETFEKDVGTICHEIEHNLGILIIDKGWYGIK